MENEEEKVTMNSFDDFKLEIINDTIEYYKDNETLDPMIFYVDEHNKGCMLPIPAQYLDIPQTKDIIAFIMRKIIKERKTPYICFVSEAWTVQTTKEDKDTIMATGLQNHPDKKEIVMFSFSTKDKENIVQMLVDRTDEDNIKLIPNGDYEFDADSNEVKGRFTGLFK